MKTKKALSFNPYFNGYSTLTLAKPWRKQDVPRFNPYFNGYSTLTDLHFIR